MHFRRRLARTLLDAATGTPLAGAVSTQTREIPLQVRAAPASSFNAEKRTFEMTWTTGAGVQRMDWWTGARYIEELSMDPAHIRLARFKNGGLPFVDSHQSWETASVLGRAENPVQAKEGWRAEVRLSQREDVAPIAQDMADGILRDVSVGYVVHRYQKIDPKPGTNDLPVWRAIDWEPMEVSLVPVPADAGSHVRSAHPNPDTVRTFPCEWVAPSSNTAAAAANQARKEPTMLLKRLFDLLTQAAPKKTEGRALESFTEEELVKLCEEAGVLGVRAAPAAPAAPAPAAPAVAGADDVVRAERARIAEIDALAARHGFDAAWRTRMVDGGHGIDAVRAAALEALAARSAAAPISGANAVHLVSDETVNRREHISTALRHRASPAAVQLDEGAKQYRGFTLRELARLLLEQRGIKTAGMGINEIASRAFESTSDLPAILLDAANKSLRAAYETTPRTFTAWAKMSTAPDFKNINRTQLSGAPSLLSVQEGAEIKRGYVTDGKETYALATYGRIIPINRQVIINDDLAAITRLPELAARAAADLQSDTVYSVLTANAALGVDSTALFHANHNNLTASGTAISVTSLGVARALMRKQTGLEGRLINVLGKYLIVPATQEMLALQYTSQAYIAAKQSDYNPFVGQFQVVVEPRLDANSTTAWYMAADPGQVDTVEYAFLEGQEGVYLESKAGWEVDGMELKVRLDFAAKALDFRGLYKNVGA